MEFKTESGLEVGCGGGSLVSLHVLWKDASLDLACWWSWLHGRPVVVLMDSSGRWEPAGHPDSSAHLSLSCLGDQLPDPLTNFLLLLCLSTLGTVGSALPASLQLFSTTCSPRTQGTQIHVQILKAHTHVRTRLYMCMPQVTQGHVVKCE